MPDFHTLATDNFNRADGPLSSPWTANGSFDLPDIYVAARVGSGGTFFYLVKVSGGTQSFPLGVTAQTVNVGDTIAITAIGTTISGLLNNVQLWPTTDSDFSSGSSGVLLSTNSGVTDLGRDDFACGDFDFAELLAARLSITQP